MDLSTYISKPRIIRAWFDTVLNPIISGLENEKYYCLQDNWTWKYYPNTFESLAPLLAFVDRRYQPNLEQVLSSIPELEKFADDHDNSLKELRDSCHQVHVRLLESPDFQKQYHIAKQELHDRLVPSTGPARVVMEQSDSDIAWIAQYVVNGIGNLYDYYTLHTLWNPNREAFRQVLETEDVRDAYTMMKKNGKRFLNIVCDALEFLKELRNNVSLKSDVPIIRKIEDNDLDPS